MPFPCKCAGVAPRSAPGSKIWRKSADQYRDRSTSLVLRSFDSSLIRCQLADVASLKQPVSNICHPRCNSWKSRRNTSRSNRSALTATPRSQRWMLPTTDIGRLRHAALCRTVAILSNICYPLAMSGCQLRNDQTLNFHSLSHCSSFQVDG